MQSSGTVYLVGAGPGDPGLLTLRGAELLARADVVVYDALVNVELLKLAPKSAEVIYGGKRSKDHAIPQGDLNALLVSKAQNGKTVVRLKGGDPYIFGRGGEEAEELATAGIPFEVVPGISSITAAPNYAGVPLTHRAHCSSFTVVTGHEDPAKGEAGTDWAQLAKVPGTKVVLMGMERIEQITASLIAGGMAASTPIAVIQWGTTGRQVSLDGTLETISKKVQQAGITAPALMIIGGVVDLRPKLNWFEKRSLFGQRVVVTRTREQSSELSRQLIDRGAEVLEIPTIRIEAPTEKSHFGDALIALHEYDWIVFTSPNGVITFFDYFFKAFDDLRDVGGVKFCAVGPATAAKLTELHLKVEVMPEQYVSAKIAAALAAYETIENLRILLMRAEVANRDVARDLEALGAIVDDVACYKTVPETEDANGAVARLNEHGADWLTFTSSSTVENFHARINLFDLLKRFPKTRIASIGPETTKALQEIGLKPTAEAKPHNLNGLVAALEKARA
jgi:uroporphyrinogen III methyltransferase/synthase